VTLTEASGAPDSSANRQPGRSFNQQRPLPGKTGGTHDLSQQQERRQPRGNRGPRRGAPLAALRLARRCGIPQARPPPSQHDRWPSAPITQLHAGSSPGSRAQTRPADLSLLAVRVHRGPPGEPHEAGAPTSSQEQK
jgi:hypothetical protein